MSLFGDIGKIVREVKDITDEFSSIKDSVVSSTKDLAKQAMETENIVKDGVKSTITEGKTHIATKVTDVKTEVKNNITLK